MPVRLAHPSSEWRWKFQFLREASPDEIKPSPLPPSYLPTHWSYTSPLSTPAAAGCPSLCYHPVHIQLSTKLQTPSGRRSIFTVFSLLCPQHLAHGGRLITCLSSLLTLFSRFCVSNFLWRRTRESFTSQVRHSWFHAFMLRARPIRPPLSTGSAPVPTLVAFHQL